MHMWRHGGYLTGKQRFYVISSPQMKSKSIKSGIPNKSQHSFSISSLFHARWGYENLMRDKGKNNTNVDNLRAYPL